MKTITLIILLLVTLNVHSQSFVIYHNDTINVTDKNNKKQGLWIKFSTDKEVIIEKGTYLNGLKNGTWTAYYPSGKIKYKVTFKSGKPIGPAKFYYDSGILSEEGYWNIDHWEGNYHYYHPNGQLAYDWNYDKKGKRTGEQKYYYENGGIKYTGIWNNGKTTGSLKMYDENGKLIAERIYENGKFARSVTPDRDTFYMAKNKTHKTGTFNGTGNHIVYSLDGRIEKKGFFVKGKLFNGEVYVYDDNNELKEKLIYKNGRLEKKLPVKNNSVN
ncbi:MAG: toxin-antitoxin system YwqK family antitoxin [Chlorobi bacterium]|nr:toxin-antitoxin system YwqK family antitoxin [Chlorobiota bacterium]